MAQRVKHAHRGIHPQPADAQTDNLLPDRLTGAREHRIGLPHQLVQPEHGRQNQQPEPHADGQRSGIPAEPAGPRPAQLQQSQLGSANLPANHGGQSHAGLAELEVPPLRTRRRTRSIVTSNAGNANWTVFPIA